MYCHKEPLTDERRKQSGYDFFYTSIESDPRTTALYDSKAKIHKILEFQTLENIWRQIQKLKNEKPANEDERKYLWEKEWELEEDARKVVNEYIKRWRNDVFESPVILVTEYADGDGEYYAFMEHGDIFKNLPHIRINKH